MQELDAIRLVVALRAARAAVGWSQEELALHLQIPKTTIARAELMEGGLRADQLAQLVRFYKTLGVEMSFMLDDDVTLKIDPTALKHAQERLMDDARRRADRKKTGVGLIARAMQEGPEDGSK